MPSRERWLSSGLDLLASSGPTGLTIDRLVAATGLTTGSFYHHFAGMPGFKTALLGYFEQVHTRRYIDAVEASGAVTARDKLDRLRDAVVDADGDTDLEVAIRAWAIQDEQARAAKERVDRTRLGYLRDLWFEISGDETESAHMANLLYVILLGAGNVLPPIAPDEVRELYRRVM